MTPKDKERDEAFAEYIKTKDFGEWWYLGTEVLREGFYGGWQARAVKKTIDADIEKVARALAIQAYKDNDLEIMFDGEEDCADKSWEFYINDANAAIAAMKGNIL